MSKSTSTKRATEPAGLRAKAPVQALEVLVELCRRIESLEQVLVDPSPDDSTWDEIPVGAFYGSGAYQLGLGHPTWETPVSYDTRSGGHEYLLVDLYCARLIEGFEEEESARAEEDDERRIRARQAMRHVGFYLVSTLRFGRGIGNLLREAAEGNDEFLLRVLEIDKSAVTLPLIRERLIRGQRVGDWEFFERIGKAIAAPPLGPDPAMFRVQMVTAAMWDWHLKDLSYTEITDLFVEHGLLPRMTDPQSFRKQLNRWNFKKL